MSGADAVVRLSVAVMADRRRAQVVTDLLERLDAPATVVWDECRNVWDTRRRATLAFDSDATHILVLQDDAIPCSDLVAGVEAMLEYAPDAPVSLYLGKRPFGHIYAARLRHALEECASWLRMPGPVWGVATVLPVGLARAVVEWGDRNPVAVADDMRMTRFFGSVGVECWYTLPSLVQHRIGPSLVKGAGATTRQARDFVGEEASAVGMDWSRMGTVPANGGVRRGSGWSCWDCGYALATDRQLSAHRDRRHDLADLVRARA